MFHWLLNSVQYLLQLQHHSLLLLFLLGQNQTCQELAVELAVVIGLPV